MGKIKKTKIAVNILLYRGWLINSYRVLIENYRSFRQKPFSLD